MIALEDTSRLAFGVTGPHASPVTSTAQTRGLIRDALRLGITTFDTGPAYGNGAGEKRLGAALKGVRDSAVFIMTKAGVHAGRRRDFSPGAIEMSLKDSLERLERKHVDMLWLHGPAPEELTPRLLGRLEAFRARGLFRYLGVCGRGEELDAAIAIDAIDGLMAPINPHIGDAARARLERAKARGMHIMAIETLAGSTSAGIWPPSPARLWYGARALKQRLTGSQPKATGLSASQALVWALDQDICDAVVSTTTKPAHLADNARRAGLAGPAAAS